MGPLQQIILMFQQAFDQLHVDVSSRKIEKLAIMIHQGMAANSRWYHRFEHVLALADPSDPFQTLAALFHDLIYHQVDKGFSPETWPILAPYIQEKVGDVFLKHTDNSGDRIFQITLKVFGFEDHYQLSPSGGMNEFLSALVMNKALETVLPEEILLQLMIYVEATIPFRGPNVRGESFPEILEHRLHEIVQTYNIRLPPKTIGTIITRAVLFANKDVVNFSCQDPGEFLNGTWQLLPETNTALRSREVYTIKDFRLAIQKADSFYATLNPDLVFHKYNGVPSEEEFQYLVTHAHTNLRISHEYLEIKLLAMAILDALAEISGGDAPISLFLGDIQRYVDPVKPPPPGIKVSASFDPDSSIYILFDTGRTGEIDFDIQRSPLSAFLYKYQEPALRKHLLRSAKAMFDGELSCQEFLEEVDPAILAVIAESCASTALTRREQLRHFIPQSM